MRRGCLQGLILMSGIFLSGCGSQYLVPTSESKVYINAGENISTCLSLYSLLDKYVKNSGISDEQVARIPGHPYLRVNRFLSSFRDEINNHETYVYWLNQLKALDEEARQLEITNLSDEVSRLTGININNGSELTSKINKCSSIMVNYAIEESNVKSDLQSSAHVPDNYSSVKRFIGLYPISSLFVLEGVKNLHSKFDTTFKQSQDELVTNGTLMKYVPNVPNINTQTKILDIDFKITSINLLNIPVLDNSQLQYLFERYAPIWEIDVVDDYDRLGKPYWGEANKIHIDVMQPKAYTYPSYTRFNGEVLLQLNYVIWFESRPVTGFFDLLGGHIDGITWRVTLESDGSPLIIDSMHNCGCYHMFFPSKKLHAKSIDAYEEPIFIPTKLQSMAKSDRFIIRLASGTHYIQHIRSGKLTDGGINYEFSDYDELRSLKYGTNKHRSMFGPDGLVRGTSRKEKWLFWPMGIVDPGAMRQRGHHATAFVGRRHFDEPYIFERYFSR